MNVVVGFYQESNFAMHLKRRSTHRFIVAVMTISLSVLLSSCSTGTLPVEKIDAVYACSQEYVVRVDMTLTLLGSLTRPAEVERSIWNTRSSEEWERLILARSGMARAGFKNGDKILLPAKCPKGTKAGEITPNSQ